MNPLIAGIWCLIALGFFASLRPTRALITTFVLGWLFLPAENPFAQHISGLPDLTKLNVVTVSAVLGMILFDAARLKVLVPKWIDLPMVVWCAAPFASSISNGFDAHDGLSAVLNNVTSWGLPYALGRMYLRDLASFREFVIALALGGLIYVPFCLWEMRMSPQLHNQLYGYAPGQFVTNVRYGGYRPQVFMHTPLMLGMWMACAALCATWLARTRSVRTFASLPSAWAAGLLILTTVACKVIGSITLLIAGLACLWAGMRRGFAVPLMLLAALVAAYPFVRITGLLQTQAVLDVVSEVYDTDRTNSMFVRLDNEDRLAEHALERPVFGWAGWGRSRIYDEMGRDLVLTDGLWIIVLGTTGLVGLIALMGVLVIPLFSALRSIPPRTWGHPAVAPVAAVMVVVAMYSIDSLFNSMPNPVLVLAYGGLAGIRYWWPKPRRRRAVASPAPASDGARPVPISVSPAP